MSGIRISAVAAVGTMTIAAFAGAGGLGWFINLGFKFAKYWIGIVRSDSSFTIGFRIDFLLGRLEHAVTQKVSCQRIRYRIFQRKTPFGKNYYFLLM